MRIVAKQLCVSGVTVSSLLYSAAGGLAQVVPQTATLPELVTIDVGLHQYRAAGEYLMDGSLVDAPRVPVAFDRPVSIMKYQVSAVEYAACVADKGCRRPLKLHTRSGHWPVTGVSFIDAQDYATWLTVQTGITWRLPSDEEWSYAAGSRFVDDALGTKRSPDDPSRRWLLKYQKHIDQDTGADATLKQRGAYGANERGIYDMSGNVWEWTTGCFERASVTQAGKIEGDKTVNCGVRIAEGQHRAYIPFFLRDASGGGCAVGLPPDYLGFRLVRDHPAPPSLRGLKNWWRGLFSS